MGAAIRIDNYEFNIFKHDDRWGDVGGIYMFAGMNTSGRWVVYYVGQTDSFRNRLPSHEQWEPAVRLGATHVHAMVLTNDVIRDRVETELIRRFNPPLNTQKK